MFKFIKNSQIKRKFDFLRAKIRHHNSRSRFKSRSYYFRDGKTANRSHRIQKISIRDLKKCSEILKRKIIAILREFRSLCMETQMHCSRRKTRFQGGAVQQTLYSLLRTCLLAWISEIRENQIKLKPIRYLIFSFAWCSFSVTASIIIAPANKVLLKTDKSFEVKPFEIY